MRRQLRLIYDGDCGFCTSSARWLARVDWRQRLEIVPWQAAGVLAEHGLSARQTMESVWLIERGGRQRSGADAVSALLADILPFPPIRWLYLVPGLRQLADASYRWVARNRYRLPGATSACALPPADDQPG